MLITSRALVQRLSQSVLRASQRDWGTPPHDGSRGITVCAGGPAYFTCAYVLVRMLRFLECNLPIQLWYVGEDEMSARMRALLRPFDVEFVDANSFQRVHPVRGLKGWPLKPYAILHSKFREVIALDADNIPIRNPEYLFEYRAYKSRGAIFWPDISALASKDIWTVMDLPVRREPEFESGQIVLDKFKCWEPLNLAMWMNERHASFYKFIHGDKDTFRFAWHRYGRPFAMPRTPVQVLTLQGGTCCGGVMCQHDLDGFRLFQHRNLYKWSLHGLNPRIPGFLFEGECREFLSDLRGKWDGRVSRTTLCRKPHFKNLLSGGIWLVTFKKVTPEKANVSSPLISKQIKAKLIKHRRARPSLRREEWLLLSNGQVKGSQDSRFRFWSSLKDNKIDVGDGTKTYLTLSREDERKPLTFSGYVQAGSTKWQLQLTRLDKAFPVLVPKFVPHRGLQWQGNGNGNELHVCNSAAGIGDHVMAFYACVGLSNAGFRITFHTHCVDWFCRISHPGIVVKRTRLKRQAIVDSLQATKTRMLYDVNEELSLNLRHAPDRSLWYSSSVAARLGIETPSPERPLRIDREVHKAPFDFKKYVLLAPFPAWQFREWPQSHWTRLAHLLIENNYHVVAIGLKKDETKLRRTFGETCAMWVSDQTPEWVMSAMLKASIVIGCDSGMVHVAGLLNVPTLCLHSHLSPQYLFSAAPSVQSICPEASCTFCRWQVDRGYMSSCDVACSALATVGPEAVCSKALQMLSLF